ncbi:uncharacterized protein LOC127872366 [Dreissena polymorpha]|uniref:uncharacterized protein LOC127872366 n=1 Tax=Dreissena polymorpha TaxID=45954 RepID=UPI0022653B01|nr:uncharacterized protein LOC127872366 [Dreissena polymorpha]
MVDAGDYVNGNGTASQDPDSRWLITNVGYVGTGSLPFSFEFDYTRWLGTTMPTGDCALFTTLQEAETQAANLDSLDYPESPQAETFLNESIILLQNSHPTGGSTTFYASCSYSFPGLEYGANEAYSLISFTEHVDLATYVDYDGDNFFLDPNGKYIIIMMSNGANGNSQITFNVQTNSNVQSIIANGKCKLYIGQSAAIAAGDVLTPTTTSQAQVTTSPADVTSQSQSTTQTTADVSDPTTLTVAEASDSIAPVTESTTTAVPSTPVITDGQAPVVTDSTSPTVAEASDSIAPVTESTTTAVPSTPVITDGQSQDYVAWLPVEPIENQGQTTVSTLGNEMSQTSSSYSTTTAVADVANTRVKTHEGSAEKHQFATGTLLWDEKYSNILRCMRRCLRDLDCEGFVWKSEELECQGYKDIETSGLKTSVPSFVYTIETL